MSTQLPTMSQLKTANALSDEKLVAELGRMATGPLVQNWNPLIHDVDCMQLRLAQKIESQTETVKMVAKKLSLSYDTHKQAVTRRVLCLICYVSGTQATTSASANTSPYVTSVDSGNYRMAA